MTHKHYLFLFLLFLSLESFGQPPNPDDLSASFDLSTIEGELQCGRSILDFGRQEVGSLSTKKVAITNTGTAPLIIYGYDFFGDPIFEIDINLPIEGMAYIAPGKQLIFSVSFRPAGAASYTGYFKLSTSLGSETLCHITLGGEGENTFPFDIEYRDRYTSTGVDIVLADYVDISCGGELQLDLSGHPTFGAYSTRFRLTNQTEEEWEVCAEITQVGANTATQTPPCEEAGPSDPESNSDEATFYAGFGYHPPGRVYTYTGKFIATSASGVVKECIVTIVVDKPSLPDPCLSVLYSINGGANWQSTNCGENIYIDQTDNPSDEAISLRFHLISPCSSNGLLSGETIYSWNGEIISYDPVEIEPLASTVIDAGDPVLAADGIYVFSTTFQLEGTDYPGFCPINIIIDKQMDIKPNPGSKLRTAPGGAPLLFPTVAKDLVHLQFQAGQTSSSYIIYNNQGQALVSGRLDTEQAQNSIDISALPMGHYFLKLAHHSPALRFIKTEN